MNMVKKGTQTCNTKKIKIGSKCNTKIHIFPYCAIKAKQRQSNYVHLIPMNGVRFREIQLESNIKKKKIEKVMSVYRKVKDDE